MHRLNQDNEQPPVQEDIEQESVTDWQEIPDFISSFSSPSSSDTADDEEKEKQKDMELGEQLIDAYDNCLATSGEWWAMLVINGLIEELHRRDETFLVFIQGLHRTQPVKELLQFYGAKIPDEMISEALAMYESIQNESWDPLGPASTLWVQWEEQKRKKISEKLFPNDYDPDPDFVCWCRKNYHTFKKDNPKDENYRQYVKCSAYQQALRAAQKRKRLSISDSNSSNKKSKV